MKFDTFSFLIGLAVAIIIGMLYTTFVAKKSFYEGSMFSDGMSVEDARKLLDNETETMKIKYQQKEQSGTITDDDKKKYQDGFIRVSTDFNSFMTKKSFENAVEESPSPAPPQEPSASPAPPQEPSPSPQTSTYEIEPY
jgi:hypothetical protein